MTKRRGRRQEDVETMCIRCEDVNKWRGSSAEEAKRKGRRSEEEVKKK